MEITIPSENECTCTKSPDKTSILVYLPAHSIYNTYKWNLYSDTPFIDKLQLSRRLGVAGLQFRQLMSKLVVGFVQHSVVLCLLFLVQGKGIIQLGKTNTKVSRFISDKGTDLNVDANKEITCFKAALTWELSAKSSALALWGADWVAGEEGSMCKGCAEESRPEKTNTVHFFLLGGTHILKWTFHFSFLKLCSSSSYF